MKSIQTAGYNCAHMVNDFWFAEGFLASQTTLKSNKMIQLIYLLWLCIMIWSYFSYFDLNCNFWTTFEKTGSSALITHYVAKLTLTHEGLVPLRKSFQFSANIATSFCQNYPNRWAKIHPFSDLDPEISE